MVKLTAHNFVDLTHPQQAALRGLEVTDAQAVLGKSFPESLDDWENAERTHALGFAFFAEGRPIGLVVFRRSSVLSSAASVHGLKIALPWQGKGLAHQSFGLGIDQLRKTWPNTRRIALSVDAINDPAIAVYLRFGMKIAASSDGEAKPIEYDMEYQFSEVSQS